MAAEERLASLEKLVAEQNDRLRKSLKTTVVVYIILCAVVLAYTTFAASRIQQMTSREEIAAMIGASIKAELPVQRAAMMARLDENSEPMAVEMVDKLVSTLPTIENEIQTMMNQYTDILVGQLQDELIPAFSAHVKEAAPEIKEQFANLTDEEVVQGVADIFIEVIEEELDKYVNDRLLHDMEELQKSLNHLGNPKAKLTRKEDAERRVIMYWSYLQDVTEMGDSPFKAIFDEVNSRYRLFTGEDMEQLDTPATDMDVKGAIEAEEHK